MCRLPGHPTWGGIGPEWVAQPFAELVAQRTHVLDGHVESSGIIERGNDVRLVRARRAVIADNAARTPLREERIVREEDEQAPWRCAEGGDEALHSLVEELEVHRSDSRARTRLGRTKQTGHRHRLNRDSGVGQQDMIEG